MVSNTLGNIFDSFSPFKKKPSRVEQFSREAVSLEEYVAQRKAGLAYLDNRISVYKKLIKSVKDKRAKKIFGDDVGQMRMAKETLKQELRDVKIKIKAIKGVIDEESKQLKLDKGSNNILPPWEKENGGVVMEDLDKIDDVIKEGEETDDGL